MNATPTGIASPGSLASFGPQVVSRQQTSVSPVAGSVAPSTPSSAGSEGSQGGPSEQVPDREAEDPARQATSESLQTAPTTQRRALSANITSIALEVNAQGVVPDSPLALVANGSNLSFGSKVAMPAASGSPTVARRSQSKLPPMGK